MSRTPTPTTQHRIPSRPRIPGAFRPAVAVLGTLTVVSLAACGDDTPSTHPMAPEAPRPEADVTAQGPDSWAARPSMLTGRRALVAAAVDGVVYAIGGLSASNVPLAGVDAYYPNTTTLLPWRHKAPLPEARWNVSGATVINDKIYVPGGLGPGGPGPGGAKTKTLFVYTPSTNSWESKADLPVVTAAGASAAINGKLYVYTPRNLSGPGSPPSLYRYDPGTNTWTARATPPHGRAHVVAGAIGGKFYLAGGYGDGGGASANLDVYDPATNTWTPKAPMPTARYGAAARVINGKLYVVGGHDNSLSPPWLSALEVYDPATNTWQARAAMPTARTYLAAAVANGVLYTLGGLNTSGTVATNEAYTP